MLIFNKKIKQETIMDLKKQYKLNVEKLLFYYQSNRNNEEYRKYEDE